MTQRLHSRRRRIATLPELSFVEAAQPASWMHEGSKAAFTSATEHICTPASFCHCIQQPPYPVCFPEPL